MRLIVCSLIVRATALLLAMDIQARLARNVVRLRSERGWSQEELAEQAELHRTYISGIEREVRNPTLLVVERLAKALGVKAGALVD